MAEITTKPKILPAHRRHPRAFQAFKYVYPVLSRRAKGISIGINTNPDKVCNFDCVYCQVDRTVPPVVTKLDMEEMREELREVVRLTSSGELFAHPPFDSVPSPLRRLNDIALSGDAEPTTVKEFSRIIETAIAVLDEFNLRGMKIVLITDAGGLDRPDVKRGLRLMDAHGGEVWAKLDAGTEEYFKAVNRTKIPFARILRNITESAKARPIVIQSLFMRLHDALPSDAEIQAYWERLNDITRAGGTIKLVQVYTVARRPAEPFVSALTDEEVDRIAAVVLQRTSLPVEKYYGG